MANNTSLVNGTAYAWVDISLNLLGRTVEGIKRIQYGHTREKQNNYGRGAKPVSRGQGNEEYTGSLTITKEEFVALQNALPPGKKLTDIKRFEIPVAYINDDNQKISDILQDVEFTGVAKDFNQNDKELLVELPLILGDIRYNK